MGKLAKAENLVSDHETSLWLIAGGADTTYLPSPWIQEEAEIWSAKVQIGVENADQ
jgi:hypothetical protein